MAKKILIVDDSPVARQLHSFIVKSAGYDIMESENGSDALEKILSQTFDMIITDINMPKMDGYTLCEEIRKNDQHKQIPIIIISTEAESKDKMKGLKAGANLYVVKPVKAEELVESIHMLLND